MAKSDAIFLLPLIGDILGIRNINNLVESDRNRLQEIANEALNKWNEKINKYNYSGANLATGKPDFGWLKRQLYENQAQQVYEFQKELNQAKKIDQEKAANIGIANPLKNIGNWFVDIGKQAGNVIGSTIATFDKDKGQYVIDQVNKSTNHATDQIRKWGNENTYNVINKYKDKFNDKQLNQQLDKINKQQIASHNSNRNALQEYKNLSKMNRRP